MDFLAELDRAILVGDGAMGTELFAAGIPRDRCLEELCVSAPDRVRAVHTAYLEAGARLIRTHSFGANALRLAAHGCAQRVSEINWTAAQLAREAASEAGAFAAGSVGPLGAPSAQRHDLFLEQIGALLDGGVRIILLEMFTDLAEIAAALEAKHTLHHCPVIASLALGDDAQLADGTTLADAFRQLGELGADVVGVNCTAATPALFAALAACGSSLPIAVSLSAGRPVEVGNQLTYPVSPAPFAAAGLQLAQQGVRLIGGCCGAGPAHIRSLGEALAAAERISCS